jgi:peptidoglycan/xylan/chitin deacetylase (PgdA/CDA1 family)
MKSLIKYVLLTLAITLGWGVYTQAAQIHILCYHTFLGKPKVYTDFSIAEFETHIQTLTQKGYRFRRFSEVRNGSVTGNKNILLVIDDGHRTAYDATVAVLKPRKIPALFAIYPGIIDTRKFAMTWAQLQTLKSNGHEFASHGYFHEFLNQKLKESRPKDFIKEAHLSKKILEKELKIPIDVYVYPFGICTSVGKELLHAEGYKFAMTIQSRPLGLPLSPTLNRLEIPRTMMTRATAAQVLKSL